MAQKGLVQNVAPAPGAVFYSLASARVLRLIDAPLSAAERSHADILAARNAALAEAIARMKTRFGNDGR